MKIHESMNVSLHKKKLTLLLLGLFLALGVGRVMAQSSTLEVHHLKMLKNDTLHFQFDHYGYSYAPQINDGPEVPGAAAYFSPSSLCCGGQIGVKGTPATNHFYYVPPVGFIGRDTIAIKYQRQFGTYGSQDAVKMLYILVLPSFLTAENDYAATLEGQFVDIDVLANDIGNGTNLAVAEIPNVNNGTAERINNNTKIRFYPTPGFKGVASLNYTICDAQGSCDMAIVSICVNPVSPSAYDSIFITTEKNAPQVVLAEIDSNYVLTLAPAHGDLDTFETLVYVPDQNYTGYDKVVFTDSVNSRTRVVQIRILDVPGQNIFLFDDVFFTAKDETLEEIHLLDNDNGGPFLTSVSVFGYPNTAEGGHLTYLPGIGKGVYQYDPPAGFEGVDKFKYKAYSLNSNYYEEAWVYIVVSNQNPAKPVFHITTPKNTPMVLGDHLPITTYGFINYIVGGEHGTVEFHPGYQTVTSPHGQVFSGYNMLVYDPDPEAIGVDEFEFNYCPGGQTSGCPLVKVIVDITDMVDPQCAGSDCVWSGDTNRDGVVDVRDILPIGLCMGEVGPVRQNGSVAWYGQYSNNWNSLFANSLGFDEKYIDADGNGIVSALDTSAIRQFYGKYHNLTPEPVGAINELPFYIQEPNFTNVSPGDVLYAPIFLGNDTIQAINAYGLTFSIDYDPGFFESVKVFFSDTAWMKYNSPILSLTHKPFPGKLDAGYSRTSGVSASGYGVIGVVEFIVIDDVAGNRLKNNSTTITLNPMGLMNGNGQTFGLNGNSFTLTLNTNGDAPAVAKDDQLMAYPNPATSTVNLHLNGQGNEMQRVMLYNMVGSLVFDSGEMQAKVMQLNVSELKSGIYTAKVFTVGEVLSKKIEVIR